MIVEGNGSMCGNPTQAIKKFKKFFYNKQFFYTHKISNILEFFCIARANL